MRAERGSSEEHHVREHVFAAACCDATVVDLREAQNGTVPHAKQQIPPATRRFVLQRDGGRCVVPGCRHSTYLDIHHIRLKSEGGDHHPDLLATLCGVHHVQIHEGRLIIDGNAKDGLVFKHADGRPYGSSEVSAVIAGMLSDEFNVLVESGATQGEAKAALDRRREHVLA